MMHLEGKMKKGNSRRAEVFMSNANKNRLRMELDGIYQRVIKGDVEMAVRDVYKIAYKARRCQKYDNGGSLQFVCNELLAAIAAIYPYPEGEASMSRVYKGEHDAYLVIGLWAHRRIKHLFLTNREKYVRLSTKIDMVWNEIPF